jgi:hypothetical protein
MNDVEALMDALRVLQSGGSKASVAQARRHQGVVAAPLHGIGIAMVASRDEDLMRRLVSLQRIVGGSDDSDEAIMIRALAGLAGLRYVSLETAAQTRAREADTLAATVRRLTADGLTASQIAVKVGRSESRVRALRARARTLTG